MGRDEVRRVHEDVAAAYFNASMAEEYPDSYGADELANIVGQIDEAEAAADDAMQEDFKRLSKAEQAKLLELLSSSGFKDRQWWETLLDYSD